MTSSSRSRPVIDPRREAQPLPFEVLTDGQKEAARRVCGLVEGLANLKLQQTGDSKGVSGALARISDERHNGVILIDGGRGSGKTCLLLSLLRQWKAPFDGEDIEPSWKDSGIIDGTGRILPLELIDLGSLPRTSSLALHLTALLHQVVDAIDPLPDSAKEAPPAPWALHDGDEPASRTRWERFLRATAVGWVGNLRERRPHIDPETFVAELDESERERLEVVQEFERFVDALVDDYLLWTKKTRDYEHRDMPLFVVPIDDADMNPERAQELLHLVGVLRHPRVVFLLTGHSELFRAMLKVHFAGAIRAPANGIELKQDELQGLGVHGHVAILARRNYDKIIPPQHRCEIPPMAAADRVEIFFEGSELDRQKDDPRPGPTPEFLARVKKLMDREPQSGLALPDRMRPLLDLRDELKVNDSSNVDEQVGTFIAGLWNDAVEQESALDDEEFNRLRDAVRLADPDVRHLIGGYPIKMEASQVVTRYTGWPIRAPETEIEVQADNWTASFYLETFDLEPRAYFNRYEGDSPPSYRLSTGTAGAWLLAAAASELRARSDTGTGTPSLAGIELSGSAVPTEIRIPWPVPSLRDTEELDRLRTSWHSHLDSLAGRSATVGDYARAALSSILAAAGVPPSEGAGWTEILERFDKADRSSPLWKYRRELILFAAPEAGLEMDEREELLSALKALKLIPAAPQRQRIVRLETAFESWLPIDEILEIFVEERDWYKPSAERRGRGRPSKAAMEAETGPRKKAVRKKKATRSKATRKKATRKKARHKKATRKRGPR